MTKGDGVADGDKKSKKRKLAVVVHQEKDDDESPKRTKSAKKKKKKKAKEVNEDDSQDSEDGARSKRRKTERTKTTDSMDIDQANDEELDTTKPSAVFKAVKGRDYTLSLALPGSFIANVISLDQKSDLAARIARAAAVFCVDEIVVFDDAPEIFSEALQPYRVGKNARKTKAEVLEALPQGEEAWKHPDQFLFHVLSYLECPGQLRQYLFPMHPNLAGSARMPPLDMPHHMKKEEWCQYREGVSLDPNADKIPGKKGKSDLLSMDAEESSLIDCGLPYPVKLNYPITPHSRVTLRFGSSDPPPTWPNLSAQDVASLDVDAVTPHTPREEGGYYWGYTPRRAGSLSEVFTDCPFEGGYDYSIGTSERGVHLADILPDSISKPSKKSRRRSAGGPNKLPEEFKHLLLVFGGVSGLEPAVACDPVFKEKGLTKETAHAVFDAWVNLVPGQGSRTIRLEEAVWIGLMGFRGYVESQGKTE